MARYTVEAPDGRRVTIEGDSEPTESDRAAMFDRYKEQPNPLEGKDVIAVHV